MQRNLMKCIMKYKNKLKNLQARIRAWEAMSEADKHAMKKPGSEKK